VSPARPLESELVELGESAMMAMIWRHQVA
jgi:hypothetical protein